MDEISIPLTILTAIISACAALLGVYISNRGQEKRLEIQFKYETEVKISERSKEKLEEMFLLFQKWETDITTLYIRFIGVYKGDISYSDAQKEQHKNSLQEKGDYQKFQAILNLYFPDLTDSFHNVVAARREVMAYCYGDINASPAELPKFCKAQENFEQATASFRSDMSDHAKKL